jgi:uncharacterized protein (TIGR02246 family)
MTVASGRGKKGTMSLPVEDVIAIQALVARYNFAVDEGDPEGFAGCFTQDGEFSWAQNEFHGRDELVAFAKTLGGSGQMRHVVTSMLADGDRERATVRSYCHVTSVGGDGKPFISVQGVYEDELAHGDGGWRFTRRRFVSDR